MPPETPDKYSHLNRSFRRKDDMKFNTLFLQDATPEATASGRPSGGEATSAPPNAKAGAIGRTMLEILDADPGSSGDHLTINLSLTPEMAADIDKALILVQDTLIRSRTEFIRAACQQALDTLAKGCGDAPIGVEQRKARVFGLAD